MVPHIVLTVLLSSLLNLLLLHGKFASFFLEFLPLLLNFILKLGDFVIITLHSNLELSCTHLIYIVDFGFKALNCLLDRVKCDLLDKDLIRDGDVGQGLLLKFCLRSWVKVFNTEASKGSVNTNREKFAVIIV